MIRNLLCCFGLHLHWFYYIHWVDHPEGKLGYWYCPTCFTTFDGCIHEPNPPRMNLNGQLADDGSISGNRIREVSKKEVRQFLFGN